MLVRENIVDIPLLGFGKNARNNGVIYDVIFYNSHQTDGYYFFKIFSGSIENDIKKGGDTVFSSIIVI